MCCVRPRVLCNMFRVGELSRAQATLCCVMLNSRLLSTSCPMQKGVKLCVTLSLVGRGDVSVALLTCRGAISGALRLL